MLKYKNIIQKLTLEEKVALLTDFSRLSDAAINAAGVPKVIGGSLGDMADSDGRYPSFGAAVRSWDDELIARMSADLTLSALGSGINLIVTPDLKSAVNPYKKGLSEDPAFNAQMGRTIVRAVHSSGAAVALGNLSVDGEDICFLDTEEDKTALDALFAAPFDGASAEDKCDAVVCSLLDAGGGYVSTNARLFARAASDSFVIGRAIAPGYDCHEFFNGGAIVGGAGLALNRAVGRYKQLVSFIADGSGTERDLEVAVADGKAVSEETVDAAVDGVIDFAMRVAARLQSFSGHMYSPDTAEMLARESIVLLKNDGVLPLRYSSKIAIIGDFSRYIEGLMSQYQIVAAEKGYDPLSDRSDVLLQRAVRACAGVDAVVVILGPDARPGVGHSASLAANKFALIEELKKSGKRVIAVLADDTPCDLSFDVCCSALLVAPSGCESAGFALADVLSGRFNPSGRLTRTYYCNTDKIFSDLSQDVACGSARVGVFTGYRYYLTSRQKVRYHFGFGLSYTKFSYSKLRVTGDELSFTLKNCGRSDGAEVVQVYTGPVLSKSAVPARELKAFKRVSLRAGESRRVRIHMPRSSYQSCGSPLAGLYMVGVGPSAGKLKLRTVVRSESAPSRAEGAKLNSFMRNMLNVTDNRMSLAEGRVRSRKIPPLMLLLIPFIVLVVTAAASAACYLAEGAETILWQLVLIVGSVVFAVALIVTLVTMRAQRRYNSFVSTWRCQAQPRFLNAQVYAVTPEDLFDMAFKKVDDSPVSVASLSGSEPHYTDKDLTFAVAFRDLKKYLAESGVYAEDGLIRDIFSSMAVSRLVIVPGILTDRMNLLCRALAQYFGTHMSEDNLANCQNPRELFFIGDEYGGKNTGLNGAIKSAADDGQKMHIAVLSHINPNFADGLLCTLACGIESNGGNPSPFSDFSSFLNGTKFPRNLWIFAGLDGDASVIRRSVADMAAVLVPDFRVGAGSVEKSVFTPLGFHQFENMRRIVREKYPLEERLWKRIDRFEEVVSHEIVFKLGNRQWNNAEEYMAVGMACGGDSMAVLDRAVSALVIAGVLPAWEMYFPPEQLAALLDNCFGEGCMNRCKSVMGYLCRNSANLYGEWR